MAGIGGTSAAPQASINLLSYLENTCGRIDRVRYNLRNTTEKIHGSAVDEIGGDKDLRPARSVEEWLREIDAHLREVESLAGVLNEAIGHTSEQQSPNKPVSHAAVGR